MQPDVKIQCTTVLIYKSVENNGLAYKNLMYYKRSDLSGKDKWCCRTTDQSFQKKNISFLLLTG